MERISLYRKWRPQRFDEVIGQPHVTETLSNALNAGRLVHAYLFVGPRGTGKTTTARILAKAINCENGPTPNPCDVCSPCTSIIEGRALDVVEIDAASNRRIDEIRDLLEKIPYMPTHLRKKVYIIDEVHQLTAEASSALLKTLEEPPEHVVFILATTEPQKLLPTIISRCQRYEFKLVSARDISVLLAMISESEGIRVEKDAVWLIAEHSKGSVRDAIGILDQISVYGDEVVNAGRVASILGEVEAEILFEMTDLIVQRDADGALRLFGRVVDSGREPWRFVESLIEHMRYLFLIQNAANPGEILGVPDEHFEKLSRQAEAIPVYEITRVMEKLARAYREMRHSEKPRLMFECALVELTRLEVDITLEGLLFRIEELERKISALSAPALEWSAGRGKAIRAEAGKPEPSRAKRGRIAESDDEASRSQGEAKVSNAGKGEKKQGSVEISKPPYKPTSAGERVDGEAEPALVQKEKARRALAAVISELKREGKIKAYAVLTRARVVSATETEVVIGFPDGAAFAESVLSGPGELEQVKKVWAEVVGRQVDIRIEAVEKPDVRNERKARDPIAQSENVVEDGTGKKKGEHPKQQATISGSGKVSKGLREKDTGRSADSGGERQAEDQKRGEFGNEVIGAKERAESPEGKSAEEIVRMLKNDFGGEIVE